MSFTGTGIEVNLSSGSFRTFHIKDDEYEKSAGTAGIAYRIAKKNYRKNIDPLGKDNFIILSAGILTATSLPATKTLCITKNPLNNTFGASVVGGKLANHLKTSGYDIMVIKGRAKQPIVLRITSGGAEFLDGDRLWGLDALRATKSLKKGDESIITIGQAGENLVPISTAILDGIHHIGRGFGAVLGSKNIKAIILPGGEHKPIISDEERFKMLSKELIERIGECAHSELGRMDAWDAWGGIGYLTTGMRSKSVSDGLILEYGAKYLRLRKEVLGCYPCPVPCKSVFKKDVGVNSYFTLSLSFGVRCGLETAESALECHDIANRLGIDELIFSELFDMLMAFKETAKIFEDEIELELKRDAKSVIKLLNMTAFKIGIGEYIGRGLEGLVDRFGEWVRKESHLIKGTGWIYDPRVSFGGEAFGVLTGFGNQSTIEITSIPRRFEKIDEFVKRVCGKKLGVFEDGLRVDLLTMAVENWLWVLNSMGFCIRESIERNLSISFIKDLFNSATGFHLDEEDILRSAEDTISTIRKLNCGEGYSIKDDLPPQVFFEPLKFKRKALIIEDYITGKPLKLSLIHI